MNTIHQRTHKQLIRLAVVACCLLAAHPALPTSGGQVVHEETLDLNKIDAATLAKVGPVFADDLFLNKVLARVFVGRGPMVVDYKLGKRSVATLTLKVMLKEGERVFTRPLATTGEEGRQDTFELPVWLGKKPLVADLSVTAENTDQNDKQPPDFEVYGLGWGKKAVGSMVLERLGFASARVRATQQEQVTYSFYSRYYFRNASVEFRLRSLIGGIPVARYVYNEPINGIRPGERSGEWDGKNRKGEISKGPHQLVVKAWYDDKGYDWTRASSRQRVVIE